MCKKYLLKVFFYSGLAVSFLSIGMKIEKAGIKRELVSELDFDGYRPIAPTPQKNESRESDWSSPVRNDSAADDSDHRIDSGRSGNFSDSDSPQLADDSDDDDETIFSPTTDEYVESCYSDKLVEFKHWAKQSVRKLRLLNDLARVQNMTDDDSPINDHLVDVIENKKKVLAKFKLILNRLNAAGKTYFCLLFDLERFLSTTPSSLLITNTELCQSFCEVLKLWLENSCFDLENYEILKGFLLEFFKNGVLLRHPDFQNPPIKQVYNIWKKSLFFDEKRLDLIHQKRDFIKALYFGFLMDRLNEDLIDASFPLKTITEVGQGSIGIFHDYLVQHNIPFVGPYKAPDYWGKQIIYFISSCNPTESVANGMTPLYGTFKFPLRSLQLPKEQALTFWDNLEKSPFWLLHFPPLFNSALDPMREKFYELE